jgi:CheY-like chemotaxis protein
VPEAPLILVVDDDQQVREVIGEYLERRGCRISLANDRAAGERILRDRDRPALLIGDAALRDGGGLGLAEIARKMGVPALLISGEPQAIQRLEGGPTPFLHKPFRLADLERELTRLLPAGQMAGRPVSYRIYFRDHEGLTAGRHDFYASDDDAAMVIAALLCDACSDVCETFELWDGTRISLLPQPREALLIERELLS